MRRGLATGLLAGLVLGLLAIGTPAGAYHTHFQYGCNDTFYNHDPVTRSDARDYAYIAAAEGYQWGGGCWNGNNVDDSPGDPPEDPNTLGEGPDCSGFTFKVWREDLDENNQGAWQWNMLRNVHGPYSSGRFQNGDGAPNVAYPKSALIRMDALASPSHIGIVYARNADGSDQIIEAKGEDYGVNIWTRTYRGDPAYGGVRRLGWDA